MSSPACALIVASSSTVTTKGASLARGIKNARRRAETRIAASPRLVSPSARVSPVSMFIVDVSYVIAPRPSLFERTMPTCISPSLVATTDVNVGHGSSANAATTRGAPDSASTRASAHAPSLNLTTDTPARITASLDLASCAAAGSNVAFPDAPGNAATDAPLPRVNASTSIVASLPSSVVACARTRPDASLDTTNAPFTTPNLPPLDAHLARTIVPSSSSIALAHGVPPPRARPNAYVFPPSRTTRSHRTSAPGIASYTLARHTTSPLDVARRTTSPPASVVVSSFDSETAASAASSLRGSLSPSPPRKSPRSCDASSHNTFPLSTSYARVVRPTPREDVPDIVTVVFPVVVVALVANPSISRSCVARHATRPERASTRAIASSVVITTVSSSIVPSSSSPSTVAIAKTSPSRSMNASFTPTRSTRALETTLMREANAHAPMSASTVHRDARRREMDGIMMND